MLHEVLYETAFTDEQEDAKDFDAIPPDFFRLDRRVAIGKQGLQEYSSLVTIFEIGFKSRKGHEWMIHGWDWAEGARDTFVFDPSDEL
jgi:hypothetical protein